MRKLFAFMFCMVVIVSISLVSYAHPGRTDASGGHRDISTGEYHYHHGQPAHQHIDEDGDGDLDCPYDYEQVAHSKTRNGVTGISPTIKPKITVASTPTPKPENTLGIGGKIYLVIMAVLFGSSFAITIVGAIVGTISDVVNNNRKKKDFEAKKRSTRYSEHRHNT